VIYILKFDKPIGTERHSAQYYIGYCRDEYFSARLKHHKKGTGAAITRAAVQRGIGWQVVVTFDGDRTLERRLKNCKNTPRILRNLEKNPLWRPQDS
jgi:predicted GIY-YIG superfamily endonuclease